MTVLKLKIFSNLILPKFGDAYTGVWSSLHRQNCQSSVPASH